MNLTSVTAGEPGEDGLPAALGALTVRLRDLCCEHFGDTDALCREASCILAYRLRRDGHDARVTCGLFAYNDDRAGQGTCGDHAHVRVGETWILDPTREQFFEPSPPLICRVGSRQASPYLTDETWPGWQPPARPDEQTARAFLSGMLPEWTIAHEAVARICRELDCPEIAPRRANPPSASRPLTSRALRSPS